METSWNSAPRPNARESDAKEAFAPAQNRDDGIEEADGIESGGDTKPEEAGFAHDRGCFFSIRLCQNRGMAVVSTSWSPDLEYVDGRSVERNAGELDHSYLVGRMATLLDRRGLLPFISLTTQVTPTRFRIPDVLAVRQMPSGVENIWVIDPKRHRPTIETRDGSRVCHDKVETSDGAISIPLSEIFADMPSTEDE